MAWSPDSQLWAVGNENGTVSIYDTTAKVMGQATGKGNANCLAWSPDGKLLADGDAGLVLWKSDGSLISKQVSTGRMQDIAWSPNGKLVAAAYDDNNVRLWSYAGKLVGVLSGHTSQVNKIAWSPDGKTLASASEDKTIRLWKVSY